MFGPFAYLMAGAAGKPKADHSAIEEASTATGSTDGNSDDGRAPESDGQDVPAEEPDVDQAPQAQSEPAVAPVAQKLGSDKRVPPSHSAESQAYKRAGKRYRQEEGGLFIKGRPGPDKSWIPEPGALSFGSLEEALEHEKQKTLLRRATWKNLTGDGAATRRVVREEGSVTRQRVTDEADSTRQCLTDAKNALAAQLEQVRASVAVPQESARPNRSGPENAALFSRLLTELRVPELKQLLASHDVSAIGTKHKLALTAASRLTEEQLDEFVSNRSKRARTDATPAAANGQRTLTSMFSG